MRKCVVFQNAFDTTGSVKGLSKPLGLHCFASGVKVDVLGRKDLPLRPYHVRLRVVNKRI
jgi:hypothetical protein